MLQLAATEVVSGVSGETEEKIRDLFQRAKVMSEWLGPSSPFPACVALNTDTLKMKKVCCCQGRLSYLKNICCSNAWAFSF